MGVPSKCTIVRTNRQDSVQARRHGIARDRDGGNAQNTQKKRLYSMSVKLPIITRKTNRKGTRKDLSDRKG